MGSLGCCGGVQQQGPPTPGNGGAWLTGLTTMGLQPGINKKDRNGVNKE